MENLIGSKLDHYPFRDLTIVADLIYFDGPILSLFKNTRGDNYLYCWSDSDEHYNRWAIFRVTDECLNLYLAGKVSLRELMLQPVDRWLYMVDIDDDLECRSPLMVSPVNLPQSYLPDKDSFYDFEPLFFEMEEEPKSTQDIIFTPYERELLPIGA